MNNYVGERRNRNRTLLIVEGDHEKNKLFWLLFKCFPELEIDTDDVWIYGTNIYMLYADIVKEYGSEWAESGDDIDLPFVISKKKHPDSLCYKNDFKNIILVFDFERHDTNFSERKIKEIQRCFIDETDMGKLYINYPMIESYQHLKSLPDDSYIERTIPVSLQPGHKYKALVEKDTVIDKVVSFPHKIDDLLEKNFGLFDAVVRKNCCNAILNISNASGIDTQLDAIFKEEVEDEGRKTLTYQMNDWVSKQGYATRGETYWDYVREIFKEIVFHNIRKATYVQHGRDENEEEKYKECFENLDLIEILNVQNEASRDEHVGFIWVLNTCIFLVANYKTFWQN